MLKINKKKIIAENNVALLSLLPTIYKFYISFMTSHFVVT